MAGTPLLRLGTALVAGVLSAALGGCAAGDDPQSPAPEDPVVVSDSAPVSSAVITPVPPPPAPATTVTGTAPQPGRGVYGRITATGAPVAGAMLQPAPGAGNPAPEREVFAVSAVDGSYGLGLSPGRWDITVYADGYAAALLHVTVPERGQVRADVVLRPID